MNLFDYLRNRFPLIQTGRNYRLNAGGAIIFSLSDNGEHIKMASNEVIFKEMKKYEPIVCGCNPEYKVEKRQIKNKTEFVFLGTDESMYYGNSNLYFRIKNSHITIKVSGEHRKPFQALTRALENQNYKLVREFNPHDGVVSAYDRYAFC